MPSTFPVTRYLLIGLAAVTLASALPELDTWFRAWTVRRGLDRQITLIEEMPVRVRPLSPLH